MEDGEQKCKLRMTGAPVGKWSKWTRNNIQSCNEEKVAEF